MNVLQVFFMLKENDRRGSSQHRLKSPLQLNCVTINGNKIRKTLKSLGELCRKSGPFNRKQTDFMYSCIFIFSGTRDLHPRPQTEVSAAARYCPEYKARPAGHTAALKSENLSFKVKSDQTHVALF